MEKIVDRQAAQAGIQGVALLGDIVRLHDGAVEYDESLIGVPPQSY
jgi:hypothetical protein